MALAALVPGASAEIRFRGDFEPGPARGGWQQFDGLQHEFDRPLSDSFSVVGDPARQGRYAARVTARHGYSPFGFNESTELSWLTREDPGTEFYYAWSTRFEPAWSVSQWGIFAQFYTERHWLFTGPPPIAFDSVHDRLVVHLNTGASSVSPELERSEYSAAHLIADRLANGSWNDFVVRVRWADDWTGILEIWHRVEGESEFRKPVSLLGIPTLRRHDDHGADSIGSVKLGIYRKSNCGVPVELDCASPLGIQGESVLHHDGFVSGSGFDEVVQAAFSPRIPLPGPTLMRDLPVETDAGCEACRVTEAPLMLAATVGGGDDAVDTAFGRLDLGSGGAPGEVYLHDRLGLGAGHAPAANLAVLQALDDAGELLYELYVAPDRTLWLWSPAGGLRTNGINASTGVTVPNDGTETVRVDVGSLRDEWFTVRVDGVDRIALAGLTGGITGHHRHVLAGIHHYDGTSTSPITVVHRELAYAQTGWIEQLFPPVSTAPPLFSGDAIEGRQLTATPGGWVVEPALLEYQWERCAGEESTCTPIDGATGAGYRLVRSDVGSTVRVVVSATNAVGTTAVASARAGPIVGNLAPNGDFELDPAASYYTSGTGTFTWASDAAFSGSRSLKLASTQSLTALARWMSRVTAIPVTPGRKYTVSAALRTAAVRNKASLAVVFYNGSTYGSAYTAAPTLTGSQPWTPVSLQVTAPAGAKSLRAELRLLGPGTLWADALTVLDGTPPPPPPAPPTNLSPPVISGVPRVGSTLSVGSPGTWAGDAAAYSYEWQRCDVGGGSCIPAGTAPTLALAAGDVGTRFRLEVTATNPAGTSSATSVATAEVEPAPLVTNLAPNGDVESDPSVAYYASGSGTFSWTSDAAFSGLRSLKIVSTQASSGLARWMTRTTQIPVTPGREYTIAASLRTASVTNKAMLAGVFYNGSTYSAAGSSPSVSATQDWTTVSVRMVAPAGSRFLRVEARLYGPGTLWADAFSVISGG